MRGFEVFVAAFYRRSKVARAVSKDLNRGDVFSPKFGSAAQFSPPAQRSIVHFPPFPVDLKNLPPSRSNSNDFCFIAGALNFPLHPATFLSPTAQLDINVSDRSSKTTATYQTGEVVGRGLYFNWNFSPCPLRRVYPQTTLLWECYDEIYSQ